MCKHSGKSVDHLFLHCDFALKLWDHILSLSKEAWVMPSYAIQLFSYSNAYGGGSNSKKSWSAAQFFLTWCIWKECNKRLFEGLESLVASV